MMKRLCRAALLAAALPWACATVPDLGRGKAALERGDLEAAKKDLVPLAELGYDEAKLAMGKAYADIDDPQARQQAITWLREVGPKPREGRQHLRAVAIQLLRKVEPDHPEVRPRLAKLLMTSADQSDWLEAEQLLLDGDATGDPDSLLLLIRLYREHPQLTDEANVNRLLDQAMARNTPVATDEVIDYLRAREADPERRKQLVQLCESVRRYQTKCLRDMAEHYQLTGQRELLRMTVDEALVKHEQGEFAALELGRMGNDLLDVPDPQFDQANDRMGRELLRAASEQDAEARAILGRLLLRNPDLRRDGDDPLAMLRSAADEGSDRAALELGRAYMKGERAPPDPELAERYLRLAAGSRPGAHYSLGQFYERGYAGRPEPELALEHYLAAARGGYRRADLALAQLYWNQEGVQANPILAHAFARIARHNAVKGSEALAKQTAQQLDEEQFRHAEAVANQEFQWRQLAFQAQQSASSQMQETAQ